METEENYKITVLFTNVSAIEAKFKTEKRAKETIIELKKKYTNTSS